MSYQLKGQLRNKITTDILNLIDKIVEVTTIQGKKYIGKIASIEPESLNLILSEAKDEKGKAFSLILLHGIIVGEIKLISQYIDLRELVKKLENFFPRLVTYDESSKIITVADRVRIFPNGVVEGKGPIAERVRSICEEFFK